MERERQFYGEEFDETQGIIKEETENKEQDHSDDDDDSDDDLTRSNPIAHGQATEMGMSMVAGVMSMDEDEETDEIDNQQSHYQIMKAKMIKVEELKI